MSPPTHSYRLVACPGVPALRLFVCLFFLLVNHTAVRAQNSLTDKTIFSGYIESYYGYDISQPISGRQPPFLYNYARHNEVNVNLAFVKAAWKDTNARGNLALMAGTYPEYNLAHEPAMLRHVFEANAGLRVSKKYDLWVDAGILPSHIGFESAIGKECWNLTRSMVADNTPYYEAGVRVGYTTRTKKIYAALLFLNGWQRVQRLVGNEGPAFGSQLTWSPSENFRLNWSTYAGNEAIPSKPSWRYYNNFYAEAHPWKKTGIIAGFDLGLQQHQPNRARYDEWWSAVLVIRQALGQRFAAGARTEYFYDPQWVVMRTDAFGTRGFSTSGYSVNLDYMPVPRALLRVEARMFDSLDPVFRTNRGAMTRHYFFTTALCLSI